MDFDIIRELLEVDQSIIAVLAAIALGATQVLKSVWSKLERFGILFTVLFSACLASLLVEIADPRETILQIVILTYVIAATASGTYSWVGKKLDKQPENDLPIG